MLPLEAMKKVYSNSGYIFLALFISGVPGPGNCSEAQPAGWEKYSDPKGQYTFSYPAKFGKTSRGTNSGFGDRVAALRFANFSSGMRNGKIFLGGEAVLAKGRVTMDIQAVGGLYDPISMEMLPRPLRKKLARNLPALKASNFCGMLAKRDHVDLGKKGLRQLSVKVKDAIRQIDRTRNLNPKIIFCKVSGNVASFHKTATFQAGAIRARQHIYGAIKFVESPYSSFHLVRGGKDAPEGGTVASMTRLVQLIKIFR